MRMNNERVLSSLSSFNVDRVSIESSNQVASLCQQLVNEAYCVFVSHPKKTRYIAEVVRLDALPLTCMPDEETAALREKVRRRAFLACALGLQSCLIIMGIFDDEISF
jgi:hypothetical protein